MTRDNIIRQVEERAEKSLASEPRQKPYRLIAAGGVIALAVVAMVIFFGKNNYSTQDSSNAPIIENHQTIQLWGDLPLEKREEIKAEAIQKFPEIKNIGQGVDWKPVAKWLAEEKGIIHTNPRDLFGNMKKQDDDESSSGQ